MKDKPRASKRCGTSITWNALAQRSPDTWLDREVNQMEPPPVHYAAMRKAAAVRNAVWHAVDADGDDDRTKALCGAKAKSGWVYGGTIGELLSCQRCRRLLNPPPIADGR